MALSLANLKRVRSVLPPRILIYGPPKLGKTTLANEFPDSVFLQTETGETSTDEITTFGELATYESVLEALGALYVEDHKFKTVVSDSLDKFEPMLWKSICAANGDVGSIEEVGGGYGKGYVAADQFWRDYMGGCNALRTERGMTVIHIAHSEVSTFNDPRSSSYSMFGIRLHKRAIALIQDEMDLILFLNQEPQIKQEGKGAFGKEGRKHAEGGVQRWMTVEGRPNITAGNRYNMPSKIPYIKGNGYSALAKYFPHVNGGVAPEPEAEVTEPVVSVTTKGKNAKAA